MNTKNAEPIEITAANNGVVVRTKTEQHMCQAITNMHAFNEKEDLFKFLEDYFVESEGGDANE